MKRFSTLIRQTLGILLALTMVIAPFPVPASAQGPSNYPPTWVYARAYNGWNVIGQTASTYTFNGGVCYYSPFNNGLTAPIFDFAGYQGSTLVYNPVFIQDANTALNEIVTPSSVTNTSASCGFSATTANAHTSFTLSSGTAGLQEAITNQLQTTPVFDVVLDKYWYQLVAAFPATTTPQSIIKALTGSANVGIVDTTTSPWTFYSWNGVNYVADAPSGGIPFTSLTPIAAPVALTTVAATCATNGGGCITVNTTGGTIPSSAVYTLAATYVTALGGETLMSIDTAAGATTAATTTATSSITVTSPAAETGAVGWRVWMTAASGATVTEILYASSCTSASTGQIVLNGVCAIGSPAVITKIITGTALGPSLTGGGSSMNTNANGAFPVASGTTSPLQNLISYPPFAAYTTTSQTTGLVGVLGQVNLAPGFLNTLGRHIHIHGTGTATTASSAGTLTLATKLASVPGVTAITPISLVGGTNSATAALVFTFDEDLTTTAVGTSGTVEGHGTMCVGLAHTAVCTSAMDTIVAASSGVDLTAQDQLQFTLTPTSVTLSSIQLRQLTVQIVQ